jgi:hypothetical protein
MSGRWVMSDEWKQLREIVLTSLFEVTIFGGSSFFVVRPFRAKYESFKEKCSFT